MRDKLEEILSMLRKDYNQRQELISDNCKDIENIPITAETIGMKLELDELNKELRRRNDGNIVLQNAINDYYKNFLNVPIESERTFSYDESLQLTISGDIEYNVRHPFFFDNKFYMQLLEYFIEKEDYMKCSSIKKRRNSLS